MAYEDQEARRSRVVVETPTARREVTQTEAVRVPERSGISGATVGVIVVVAVALVTILVLLLLNSQTNEANNSNLAAQQPAPVPQTTIIQQPAAQQQPPVIIQQPAPAQPAPVIINPAAPGGGTTTNVPDDAAIQAKIDKKIGDDPTYSALSITATVMDGKVTLVGTVKNDATKLQIEKMIKAIRGVREVDNQIVINAGG